MSFLKGKQKSASELMSRVHRIASLLKRWILGTHQRAAVSHEHLEYYRDESRFGLTGAGPAIEGSFSTAWHSKQSSSNP